MQEEIELNKQKGRTGKSIRVLVLGIPNVGKSSFINRISKKNTMEVGNKPGVTKQKQWIRLSNNIIYMLGFVKCFLMQTPDEKDTFSSGGAQDLSAAGRT